MRGSFVRELVGRDASKARKNGEPRFCSASTIIVGVSAISWRRKIIIITDTGVDHVYLAESSRAPSSLAARLGINKLPIRSRMISVIIGYNGLVEEHRMPFVINGCLAPARRGRKVWILLRGLKNALRKNDRGPPLIEFINYSRTVQEARTRATHLPRYNPADLSISRDSVGWFRCSPTLMHYANVIWRARYVTWVDERGRAEKTMSL